ncbi:TPA: hypothetical protein ACH3X2_008809 [Trebouxia sp. C0005]
MQDRFELSARLQTLTAARQRSRKSQSCQQALLETTVLNMVNRPVFRNLFPAFLHAAVLPQLSAASAVCELLFAGSSVGGSTELCQHDNCILLWYMPTCFSSNLKRPRMSLSL